MMNNVLIASKIALICAIALISFSIKPAFAGQDGDDKDSILSMMSEAEFRTSYQGAVRTFNLSMAQPRMVRFWVHHLTPNLERREYLNRRELLINDGANIWRYLPQENLIIKRLSPNIKKKIQVINRNISLIKQNYQIKVSPGNPFFGKHETLLVEFIPRGKQNRPFRRVWVDSASGISLRTEIYSLDQRLSFLSFFDSIDYSEQPEISRFILKVPPKTALRLELEKEFDNYQAANRHLPFEILIPAYIPPKFSLTGIKIKNSGQSQRGVVHLEYSDGLSTISLFQHLKDEGPHGNYAPVKTLDIGGKEGNLYRFGLINLLEWMEGDLRMTLVGEIEEEEMLKLAESLHSKHSEGGEK